MWAMVAFAKEHWQPLLAILPVIGILGFIAYVTRDWRIALAAVGVVVMTVYAGHLFKQGYDARERELRAEQHRRDVANEQTVARLEAEIARQKAEDDAIIAELQRQVDETPPDDRPAIPRAAGGRIRSIR